MKFEFDIKAITIVKGFGSDYVMLATEHPNPYLKEYVDGPLVLKFSASDDMGEDYVKRNFPGVPLEVIQRPDMQMNFSDLHKGEPSVG